MSDAVYELPERASDAFNARIAAGAPYDAAIDEAIAVACRVAVAEELRAQADYYRNEATREHKRCQRLADHAPKWQYESAIASAQELSAFVKHLTARADALDPEGATT